MAPTRRQWRNRVTTSAPKTASLVNGPMLRAIIDVCLDDPIRDIVAAGTEVAAVAVMAALPHRVKETATWNRAAAWRSIVTACLCCPLEREAAE
jgi:hypothetical protein